MEDSTSNAPAAAAAAADADADATNNNASTHILTSPVPVPVPVPNNTTTPGKANPNTPFGSTISPPGMRLRSGKKKKPTPLKGKSTGKRRRSGVGIGGGLGIGVGINYDSASDYESDAGSMGPGGPTTATATASDGEKADVKRQRVELSSSSLDRDIEMEDEQKHGDANGNRNVNGTVNGNSTSIMMETIPEQNEVEAAATEAERMASEDRSASATNGSESGSAITPVAAAAAAEAARIATIPPNNNIISSPPGIQLRLPSQHTPGPSKTSFITQPQASVSSSVSTSAYQGTARLRDFTTPAKSGRFAPSPAFSNGASAAGTDSEVERLDLTMTRDDLVEAENKDEREEGRRDGLVHAYFKDGKAEIETDADETSAKSRKRSVASGAGGEGMSVFGLCCIALVLHFVLTWMSGSVIRPFFVFSNVPHCADRATVSYERLLGTSDKSTRRGMEVVVKVKDEDEDEDEAMQVPEKEEEVEDTVPEPTVEEQEPEPEPDEEPEMIELEEVVENIVWVDNLELEENERELLQKRRMIKEWNIYKENASRAKGLIERKAVNIMGRNVLMNDEMSDFERKDTSKREELTAWKNALDPSFEIMDALDSASLTEKFALKDELSNNFDKLEDFVDSSKVFHDYEALNVLVTDHIRIPGENCASDKLNLKMIAEDVPILSKPSHNKKKKAPSGVSIADYVTGENVEEAKSDINEAVIGLFADIRYGSESFRTIDNWMESQIDILKDNFSLDSNPNLDNIKIEEPDLTDLLYVAPVPTPTPSSSGIALKKVQAIIDGGVETLKADITGEHDYASIRAGSKVIKSGPRQTSPSLAENLPLMNQLMGKLGLRFYGNGPHAALEPTYPQDSLGQCWSFEREGERKRITIKELQGDAVLEDDPDRGEYATLGVKLAKPIFVKSVIIEHTKKNISPERKTAIRSFRVIGFQDENAAGEPWLLGTFEYNSSDKKYLQEFEVNTKDENGLPIPKLKSIALAIDSNWGADYSCLYRFRVNGSSQRIKN